MLFVEQIRMGARSRRGKDEPVVVDRVNEQPIGPDVAFSETGVAAR